MSDMIMRRFHGGWDASGFFVGKDDPPVEASDAIRQAKLDWTVSKRRIYYEDNTKPGILVQDNDFMAVVRDTDNKRLGVVKKGYNPIQNHEAFNFLDGLAKNGDIKYHSVGTFGKGRRVWMLAKIGESEILPQDMLDHFILMYNSHDGSSSLSAVLTAIRIACTNAILGMLRRGKGSMGINIKHTKNARIYMDDARGVLQLAKQRAEEMDEMARRMVNIRMPDKKFERIAYRIFPDPPQHVATDRARANAAARRDTLTDLFHNGQGQDIPGVANTGWAAFNAVTEYVNHSKPVRGDSSVRLEKSLFGTSHRLVDRAKKLILQSA